MHPVEQFIHQAKHSSAVSNSEHVTASSRSVKEKVDPKMEKRAKRARMALLKAIAERPRLENMLDKAGTDLVMRHGRIESKNAGLDFPDVELPVLSDGSDDAERARIAGL